MPRPEGVLNLARSRRFAGPAYASVTVLGPTLGIADAWATAAFALGDAGPAVVAALPDPGVLAIDDAGVARWSALIEAHLA